ncbi:hypothetical protein SAMN02982922_2717 [Mesorhizobium australicum]|uniref:Uncharacterized protein n=1 Tax=Mesorhizobium australicum TaxID=536018 RepID=A0A1X7NY25_9HYPH|nr:hypothetical protein SAMN02982922_2717 [Mesorhizobium australicum]
MTLFPTGDRGQRYEVSSTGYPLEGQVCIAGWTDILPDAERMAAALRLAPGCTAASIRDRWAREPSDPINLAGSGPTPIEPREG